MIMMRTTHITRRNKPFQATPDSAPERKNAGVNKQDEALEANQTCEPRVIVFNLSGRGHFDMPSHDRYFAGELRDYDYLKAVIAGALQRRPTVG